MVFFCRVLGLLQVRIKSKQLETTAQFATMNTIPLYYYSVAISFAKAVFRHGLIENRLVHYVEQKLLMTHRGETDQHHISCNYFNYIDIWNWLRSWGWINQFCVIIISRLVGELETLNSFETLRNNTILG